MKTFFDRISRIISAILGWLHGKLKFRVKDRRLWDRIVVLRAQKLAELGLNLKGFCGNNLGVCDSVWAGVVLWLVWVRFDGIVLFKHWGLFRLRKLQ